MNTLINQDIYRTQIESVQSHEELVQIVESMRKEYQGINIKIVPASIVVPRTKDEQLLLLERSSQDRFTPRYLSFPGGQHMEGETTMQTGLREMNEETGFLVETSQITNQKHTGVLRIKPGNIQVYSITIFYADLPVTGTELSQSISFKPNEEDFFEHAAYWLIPKGSQAGTRYSFNPDQKTFTPELINVFSDDRVGHFTRKTLQAWINS